MRGPRARMGFIVQHSADLGAICLELGSPCGKLAPRHRQSVLDLWLIDLSQTQSCHKIKVYSVNRTKPLTAQRLKEYEEAGLDFASEPITRPVPWPLESMEDYKARYNKYPREPQN